MGAHAFPPRATAPRPACIALSLSFAIAVGPATALAAGATACGPVAGAGPIVAAGWTDNGVLSLDTGERLVPAGAILPSSLQPIPGLVEAAGAAAASVLDGRAWRLGTATRDRHGRLLAEATADDGGDAASRPGAALTLAHALVAAGAAYADPASPCGAALIQAEDAAREARRGLWSVPGAVARGEDEVDVGLRAGLHAVMEGRVSASGSTRSRVYLNFGPRWREDATVTLPKEKAVIILGDDLDPAMLRGTLVRARGIVREEGGPLLEVSAPGELEIVAGPALGGGAAQIGKDEE